MASRHVEHQLIRFRLLPAAAPFQDHVLQVLVHPIVRLELPDLQRHLIDCGISDRCKENLRIRNIIMAQQQLVQMRQVGMNPSDDLAHRAGHVEADDERV